MKNFHRELHKTNGYIRVCERSILDPSETAFVHACINANVCRWISLAEIDDRIDDLGCSGCKWIGLKGPIGYPNMPNM